MTFQLAYASWSNRRVLFCPPSPPSTKKPAVAGAAPLGLPATFGEGLLGALRLALRPRAACGPSSAWPMTFQLAYASWSNRRVLFCPPSPPSTKKPAVAGFFVLGGEGVRFFRLHRGPEKSRRSSVPNCSLCGFSSKVFRDGPTPSRTSMYTETYTAKCGGEIVQAQHQIGPKQAQAGLVRRRPQPLAEGRSLRQPVVGLSLHDQRKGSNDGLGPVP